MALIITVCVCTKQSIVYSACLKVSLRSRWCWKQETNPSLTSIWIALLITASQEWGREQVCCRQKHKQASLWGAGLYLRVKKKKRKQKKFASVTVRRTSRMGYFDEVKHLPPVSLYSVEPRAKWGSRLISSGSPQINVNERVWRTAKHTLQPACNHWNVSGLILIKQAMCSNIWLRKNWAPTRYPSAAVQTITHATTSSPAPPHPKQILNHFNIKDHSAECKCLCVCVCLSPVCGHTVNSAFPLLPFP